MNKKKITSIAVAALLTGSLLACGSREVTQGDTAKDNMTQGNDVRGNGDETEDVVRISAKAQDNGDGTSTSTVAEYPTTQELDETLKSGVNHLAYDLSDRLSENGENYFFSPYSISSALTLLDNAADGNTKTQMEDVLGITSIDDWNMQLACYMAKEQPEKAKLTSANSLWFDKSFTVADEAYAQYLPLVEFYYDAQLYKADFARDPETVRNEINRWVSEGTNGMIEDYLKQVDPSTVLALINAVYFYGEWSNPFMAEMTYEETFHGTNGDTQVDMMHQGQEWFPYYQEEQLRGISLPYGDGSKVMNVLIADENADQTAAELFAGLSESEKNEFLQNVMNADESYVEWLQLPKFQMNYSIDGFKGILESLGMQDAFDPGAADFSKIGEVYVSDIGHMAVLEVDELGSRAAAATDLMVSETSIIIEENPVMFIVDQPFVFTIQDKETGMILFMGQIQNLD